MPFDDGGAEYAQADVTDLSAARAHNDREGQNDVSL